MLTAGQWLRSVGTDLRLEGELLLAEHTSLNRTQVLAHPDTEIETQQLDKLDKDIQRVKAGEPLAYILGCREFWGLALAVSPAVLVPRPETELLVEVLLSEIGHPASVLELGTGSGAIAIALAHERSNLRVSAGDVSNAALEVARANARKHNVDIDFKESNWFQAFAGPFDVVVSNPPYISPGDHHLAALSYEPQIALVAEDNGLQALKHIANEATSFLNPGGLLLLEHGFDQGQVMLELFSEQGYTGPKAHYDLAGHHRATSARRS